MIAEITDDLIKDLIQERKASPDLKKVEVGDLGQKGFTLIVHPSGVASFSLRYRNSKGQSKRLTLGKYGKYTLTQARNAAVKKAGLVVNDVDVQEVKQATKALGERERLQTLKTFFESRYLDYCRTNMKPGSTQSTIIKRHFITPYPDLKLQKIDQSWINDWKDKRSKLGLGSSAINRPISALKAMLNRAVEWGVIDSNPLAAIKPLKEDKKPKTRYLTSDEEIRLITALEKRQHQQVEERQRYNAWRAQRGMKPLLDLSNQVYTDYLMPLVLISLYTGMRRGEVFNLRHHDINFEQNFVTVEGAGSKSGTTRHINLPRKGVKVLSIWSEQNRLKGKDLVFPSPVTGGRLDNIKKSWEALIQLAEVENFRFHDLRHSYASKLVMLGASLYDVKELLGHSSIETTQRYAHLAPEHKAGVVSLLDEVT